MSARTARRAFEILTDPEGNEFTVVAGLVAWRLTRRRHRRADDVVPMTLPAWLLPVVAAAATAGAVPFYVDRPAVVVARLSVEGQPQRPRRNV